MADSNQGIINYGSIGGNASVRITQHGAGLAAASSQLAGSAVDPALVGQLTKLIGDMQLALRQVPEQKSESADAVAAALKQTVQELVAAQQPGKQPDKQAISISAKGLLEAAQGIAGVMPIASKIAATLAGALGLTL